MIQVTKKNGYYSRTRHPDKTRTNVRQHLKLLQEIKIANMWNCFEGGHASLTQSNPASVPRVWARRTKMGFMRQLETVYHGHASQGGDDALSPSYKLRISQSSLLRDLKQMSKFLG